MWSGALEKKPSAIAAGSYPKPALASTLQAAQGLFDLQAVQFLASQSMARVDAVAGGTYIASAQGGYNWRGLGAG